jgi:drug/metabolite transporter (DMT)-like permease
MKARVVWLLLCAVWGSTWLFIKLGLRDLPPISFAAVRFLLASAILFGIVAARGVSVPRTRRELRLILTTGVLAFAFNYGLLFWGEQHISSGLAALLQATIPVFGMLFAHAYLPGERLTAARLAGVLLGVVGVGVVFSSQLEVGAPAALWGSGAVLAGAVCVAWANVMVKARGGHIDSAALAAGQMLCGLVPLSAYALVFEGNPADLRWTGLAVVCLLYLTIVGSVVAFLLYYWLVRNMDVTKTMLISLVTPLVAVTLGMLVLGEEVTWRTLGGGLLIMSGIGLVVLRRGGVPAAPAAEAEPAG